MKAIIRNVYFRALLVVLPAILAVPFLGVRGLIAQNLTGEIDGVVKDSSGAVVANATVTVKNTDQNLVVRTVHPNAEGEFSAPLLAIGHYAVTVEAPGFQTTTQTSQVHVGLTTSLAIALVPGSVSQTVQVSASTLSPQLDSAAAGTLVSNRKMTQLSLSSRNFIQLLTIQPGISGPIPGPQDRGAIASSGSVNSANLSVNGVGGAQNGYFVDGEDMQRRSAGGTQIAAYPGIDFIQEMNLQRSNYGAQYGGSGSAFVSINTKSGTTELHGGAFEFFRSQILNANGYFNNLGGVPRPGLRYNDYGYDIGGPVWVPHLTSRQNAKTFFYFGQEYLRSLTNTQETLTNIPTAAQRQGNFGVPVCTVYNANGSCAHTATSISQFDPTAQAYLTDIIDKTPLPNNPSDPQGLITSEPGTNNETQTFIRIDHQFSQKLSVFFRYLDDPFHLVVPDGLRQTGGVPGVATSTVTDGATIYLGHATYVISSRNVLDGGFAYLQGWVTANILGYLASANSPDIHVKLPYTSTLGRVPNLTINGRSYSAISPYDNREPITQVFVNDTQMLGRHTLYFGTNLEFQQEGNSGPGTTNAGAFNFAPGKVPSGGGTQFDQAFANFLLGRVTNFQQMNHNTENYERTNIYEAYAQDDFRPTTQLTMNFGLRYSYFAQPTSTAVNGSGPLPLVNFVPTVYQSSLAPALTKTGLICTIAPCAGGGTPNPNYDPLNGLIIGGKNSPYGQKVVQQPKLGFAPRVGFAYDVFGNGHTALRGGFGIYYLVGVTADNGSMIAENPPNVVNTVIQNTAFTDPAGNGSSAIAAPVFLYAQQFKPANPYLETYDVDVQHQFTPDTIVDVGYFGNHSIHEPVTEDLNAPFPGSYAQKGIIPGNTVTPGDTQQLNLVRPFIGYGPINTIANGFSSNYNGLQVSATKRLSGGSILTFNYTYSKAMSNANAPQNVYDPAAEYGPATFNRTHIFNANIVYALPFFRAQQGFVQHVLGGWEVTGIVYYGSGLPLTAHTQNVDPGGLGILAAGSSENGTGRPDYVSNPNQHAPHTLKKWFNTAAFAQVPAGQYRPGNDSVGNIEGPGYSEWDLSLFKNFKVYQRLTMQLRGESFNTFNHTNFSGVATTLGLTNYGQVTTAGPARVMQLAAKINF